MLAWLMVLGGALLRIIPHAANFAPITAAALFGGTYLPKRFALIIPLVAIAVSDYLLLYIDPFGNPVVNFSQVQPLSAMLHSTTAFVWVSFMISGLLGLWLKNHKKPAWVAGVTVVASLQFFLITNFGVWAMGAYSRGLDGLVQSYIAGLPFLKWTFLGDLFYTTVFFATYELALKLRKTPLKTAAPATES